MPSDLPPQFLRFLPDAAPAFGGSWQEQLNATTAAVDAAEAKRLRQEEALKALAHPERPVYATTPKATYMREWRAKRRLLAQSLGLPKAPGYGCE
jgi:hypothetical protein